MADDLREREFRDDLREDALEDDMYRRDLDRSYRDDAYDHGLCKTCSCFPMPSDLTSEQSEATTLAPTTTVPSLPAPPSLPADPSLPCCADGSYGDLMAYEENLRLQRDITEDERLSRWQNRLAFEELGESERLRRWELMNEVQPLLLSTLCTAV